MPGPLSGFRVLEVAQFTFVPAAGAILAEWGADVIKVEHPVQGDAARSLDVGVLSVGEGSWQPFMEHPNRGKRSIGLALEHASARKVLDELIETSDVFLTNFLPAARQKLHIDLDDIRRINPQIVYARGSGFGVRGPDAETPGYDGTAFWSRGGSAHGVTPAGHSSSLFMPSGAYGDTTGGMAIAAGICGALLGRERSGHPPVVDVSLLSVGAWSMALSVNVSLLTGEPLPQRVGQTSTAPGNPLHGQFATADGRWLQLSMHSPHRYWADVCRRLGRDDLATDSRLQSLEGLSEHVEEAGAAVRAEIGARMLSDILDCFEGMEAPWSLVQNSFEVGVDPALRGNGYISTVVDADGVERELLASPVQFDESPAQLVRGPNLSEHTDEILRELGWSDEAIANGKAGGAIG